MFDRVDFKEDEKKQKKKRERKTFWRIFNEEEERKKNGGPYVFSQAHQKILPPKENCGEKV